MGYEKSQLIEAEDRWLHKAQAERIKCSMCSTTIPYDDRDIYFRTGMCGYCHHVLSKDD